MTRRPVIVLPAILAAIPSGTSPALCHLLRRNANRLVIDKLTPQEAGESNQEAAKQRQIQSPREDQQFRIAYPQKPVQRGQGKQRHGHESMAPGNDQASYFVDDEQVRQTHGSGEPPTGHTNTRKPQTSTGPETVCSQDERYVRGDKSYQCCDREVNQHGVNGVPQDRHAANDVFLLHGYSPDQRITNRNRPVAGTNRPSLGLKSLAATPGLGIPVLLSGCEGALSTLSPAGPNAQAAAWLWWGMFTWFTAVLVVVVVLWLYAVKRAPREASAVRSRKVQNRWIIWGGVVLPITTITVLLAFGLPAGHRSLPLGPDDDKALRIDVTAHQWWWEVNYPGSAINLKNELHIPAGRPVDVHLTSADVIHSFWVPRLGGKLDVIPGRTNILRLQADQPGTYRGQCAEFCGRDHAHMGFTVTAHTPSDYSAWAEQEAPDE